MLRKIVLVVSSLCFAAPATAGVVLWDQVEGDMPFARAKELYPNAHVHTGNGLFRPMLTINNYRIDDCQASVWILIDRKVSALGAKVEGVQLFGERCDSKMFNALLAKYGEPSAVNSDNDDKKKTARWVADGKNIVFRRDGRRSPDTWEIHYTPIKDLGL